MVANSTVPLEMYAKCAVLNIPFSLVVIFSYSSHHGALYLLFTVYLINVIFLLERIFVCEVFSVRIYSFICLSICVCTSCFK